jgi:hypothetical protein
MLCGKVVEELAHEYGGPEKCPWSVILIKGIYFAGGLKVKDAVKSVMSTNALFTF